MSYILNALRKSEKERQALQPETATDRILVQEGDQTPRHFDWKMLLIVINLAILLALILAVVIGFNRKPEAVSVAIETPKPVAKSSSATIEPNSPQMLSKSPAATVEVKSPKQATSEIAEQKSPALKSPALPSPTIAELAALKQKVENPVPIKAPVQKQKEATPRRSPEPSVKDKKSSSPVKKMDTFIAQAPKPLFGNSTQAVTNPGTETGPASAPGNTIPFLDDLPEEFRHSVPRITINVFVFTPRPSDRFVMINMVKYKAGDKTMDNLEIKEIRNHSLVVGYHGRTFQIARP